MASGVKEIRGIRYTPLTYVILCVAVSVSFTSTWLLSEVGYPAVDGFALSARWIAPLVGAAAALAFALLSQNHPRFFIGLRTMVGTFVGLVVATALIYVASACQSAWLAITALSVRWIACVLRDIILGFALVGLGTRRCVIVLICAYLLRYAEAAVLGWAPWEVQVVGLFVCAPTGLVLLWWLARPSLEHLGALDTPANLRVTNPLSFLPSTGRMFGLVLLFHAALGFSTTFGAGAHAQGTLAVVALFAAMLVLSLLGLLKTVDALYIASFLLALAGFLLIPSFGGASGLAHFWCNVLCESGASLFSLTIWYLVARVGSRSLPAMLPFVCMVRAARGFGIALGTWGGAFANVLIINHVELVAVFAAAVVFVFCAYNFLFARRFSFDAVAEELEPLVATPVVAPDAPEVHMTIDAACDGIATTYALTARELDVLRLLAKGRNAAYIQSELGLTRNTAKSYVADVYHKLDVHSHQELIDVVEGHR